MPTPSPVHGQVNVPVEALWLAESENAAAEGTTDVRVAGPGGRAWRIPAFHDGGRMTGFRFAAPGPGRYEWAAEGDAAAGQGGAFDIEPYPGDNPLYRHGRLRVSADRRRLEHADGTPFFWLADTWWMGLTARLD